MLNKKKHKLLELKTSVLVESLFVWNYKTKHKWIGIEFVDYKEYQAEDDVKNIDFIRSLNEWKTLVKLYEEERELSVYFVFDFNDNFTVDYENSLKLNILYELFYLVWLSAIKQWDKLGTFIFNKKINKLYPAKKWKQNFINILQWIENIGINNSKWKNSIFDSFKNIFINKNDKLKNNNWLKYFNQLKIKNSLVLYVTDSLKIEKKQLEILSIKNDLIFCNIFDSFENNLDWKWISNLVNNNKWLNIDLDDIKNKNKYIKLRNDKISKFKRNIIKSGSKYILLDETKNIYKEIYKLFEK